MTVLHCGATLTVVADRVNSFLQLFGPDRHSPPDVIAQLRRLYYDTAGFSPLTRQVPALLKPGRPRTTAERQRLLLDPGPRCGSPHRRVRRDAPTPVDGTTRQSLTTANAHRLLPRLAG
ncbi:Amidohydrolase OS=Streptomyces griseorubiginosus OX=67304 GN=AQJ54_40835 PE=4 SV=1 [Streptomyces griseorubiginosus]